MKRTRIKFLDSLWQNADFLALAVAVQFWPLLTNTPLSLRTALTLAGLCVVYALLRVLRQSERRDSAAPPAEERREFVEHPERVLELAKLTGYDAIRRLTPYLGKWITISGRFDGMAESLQRDAAHVSVLLWKIWSG
jgi:hypothetical protein